MEKTTVFLLRNINKQAPLGIDFHTMGVRSDSTQLNKAFGKFRTFLTPVFGEESEAIFSFWLHESPEDRCWFKSDFSIDGSVNITVQSQGKAHAHVDKLATNFYMLYTTFD